MDKITEGFRKLLITKNKLLYVLLIAAAALCLIAFFPSIHGNEREKAPEVSASLPVNEFSALEEKLQRALSCIEGVGRVEVLITYKTTSKIVPATESTINSPLGAENNVTEKEEIVLITGGGSTQALILNEEAPEVLGVVVIADGAEVLPVRLNLQNAVQTALQLNASHIEVLPMGKMN